MRRKYGSGKVWISLVGLALLTIGSMGAASAQQSVSPAAATSSSMTDAQLANTRCIIGLEKFLPADYYYCLASQSYGEKSYGEAQKFFHTAASWASKPAQFVLGVMALNGDHQPVNRPLALAWMALAAERHTARFSEAYTTLRAHMSARERNESEALLRGLQPIYADATAATRAESRYRDGMQMLRSKGLGSNYCMEGMFDTAQLAGSTIGPDQAMACPQTAVLAVQIDRKAADVFEDWQGHVMVEPLQPVQVQNGKPLPAKAPKGS
jgi:TPR repeat protein